LFFSMSWKELGVSRWRWYLWRLEGYAERLLQPLRGALPRRPQLLKPPRTPTAEQPRSKAAKEAKGEAALKASVGAVAEGGEAKATEGAGGRLGLDDLHVDLE